MSFPSANPPSDFSLTARQVSQAKVISIGEKSARVMFGGRTWDISVYDKMGNAPKNFTQDSALVNEIANVFEKLVNEGVIDPTKHKSVEIEESKDRTDIKSSVKVFTSQDQTGQVQTITDHTKAILNDFGHYLFKKGLSTSSASLQTTQSKQVDITKLSTGQKAHLIQQLINSQSGIRDNSESDANAYGGKFVAFYDKENTPLTEFLGNFYEIKGGFTYEGKKYKCSEAAYQACKLEHLNEDVYVSFIKDKNNPLHKELEKLGVNLSGCKNVNDFKTKLYAAFQEASGDQALKIARYLEKIKTENLPPNPLINKTFHKTSIKSMKMIIYEKFSQKPELKNLLLATGNSYLLEHRYIKAQDDFWSDGGNCEGKNVLGKLLMEVRDELRENDGLRTDNSTDNLNKSDIPKYVKNIYKNPALNLDPFSKANLSKSSSIIPLDSDIKYIDGNLVHRDVGGGGRCADLSLADQIIKKMALEDTPDNRYRLGKVLREDAASYLKSDKWLKEDDFKNAIVTTIQACNVTDQNILSILNKDAKDDANYKQLAVFYADLITNNPTSYLDASFFMALARNNEIPSGYIQPNIRLVQDRVPQVGGETPFKEILFENKSSKGLTLTIWYNGKDHYHSFYGKDDLIGK